MKHLIVRKMTGVNAMFELKMNNWWWCWQKKEMEVCPVPF
jgi:hypothetical protein